MKRRIDGELERIIDRVAFAVQRSAPRDSSRFLGAIHFWTSIMARAADYKKYEQPIVEFLKEHPNEEFTHSQIAKELGESDNWKLISHVCQYLASNIPEIIFFKKQRINSGTKKKYDADVYKYAPLRKQMIRKDATSTHVIMRSIIGKHLQGGGRYSENQVQTQCRQVLGYVDKSIVKRTLDRMVADEEVKVDETLPKSGSGKATIRVYSMNWWQKNLGSFELFDANSTIKQQPSGCSWDVPREVPEMVPGTSWDSDLEFLGCL